MKRKRSVVSRQRGPFAKFQNNFHSAMKEFHRNIWNFYSWVGLFALLYIIFK